MLRQIAFGGTVGCQHCRSRYGDDRGHSRGSNRSEVAVFSVLTARHGHDRNDSSADGCAYVRACDLVSGLRFRGSPEGAEWLDFAFVNYTTLTDHTTVVVARP